MGVKLNPKSSLARLFNIDESGYVQTVSDVAQKLKGYTRPIDVKSADPVIYEALAPSFDSNRHVDEAIKEFDSKMQVVIVVLLNQLLKLKANNNLTWKHILGVLNSTPVLVPQSSPVEIVKEFVSENSTNFKLDGPPSSDPDPELVLKVMTWWQKDACPDPDIRADLDLDIESLAKIVTWSGITITNFLNFFTKHERHDRRLFEIGVLRFPTRAKPYFKIYRVKLFAWSDCTRLVWHQEDKNGIKSTITSQTFTPNEAILRRLSPVATYKATESVDELFADNRVLRQLEIDEGIIRRKLDRKIQDLLFANGEVLHQLDEDSREELANEIFYQVDREKQRLLGLKLQDLLFAQEEVLRRLDADARAQGRPINDVIGQLSGAAKGKLANKLLAQISEEARKQIEKKYREIILADSEVLHHVDDEDARRKLTDEVLHKLDEETRKQLGRKIQDSVFSDDEVRRLDEVKRGKIAKKIQDMVLARQ